MSWRKHETHKEETKAVKQALTKAGIKATVGHGRGTAWGWLEINIGKDTGKHKYLVDGQTKELTREEAYTLMTDLGVHKGDEETTLLRTCLANCPRCKTRDTLRQQTEQIVASVTGRHGDYGGEVLILAQ